MERAGLVEVARVGGFAAHPWRASLETPERVAAMRERLAASPGVDAGEAWRRGADRPEIVALQAGALARAWRSVAGDDELWFHLRRVERPTRELQVTWARREAPRIALDPNPGAPPAPYLGHPISLAEAARFAAVLPVVRGCSSLARSACQALDAIGQPTHALRRWAEGLREPPVRRAVWRLANPARGGRPGFRVVTLTAAHVLAELGTPAGSHPSTWGRLEAVVRGALAWRLACARGLKLERSRERAGAMLHVRDEAVGRRYVDLEDPFTPLLAIFRLGCCLRACSPTTMALELGSAV